MIITIITIWICVAASWTIIRLVDGRWAFWKD